MRRVAFALLCVSVWINYMDRGNLSVAAPALQPEMGLTPAQMGILLSGFFWTYSLLQPVAGWLADRTDIYRLYATAFALWSLAVAAGGLSAGFTSLLATRLLLGAGESIAYPAYSRILAASFPEGRRGFANAMLDVGTKAGPALGTLAGGLFIQAWGWRPFFLVMGILSLVWLGPWLLSIPPRAVSQGPERTAPSLGEILAQPTAWITFCGLFCFNYSFYFLLTWLPSYLVTERQFSLRAMAVYGALPFCATAVASLLSGIYSDRIVRRGHSPDIRRRIAVLGLLLCAAMLPVAVRVETLPAMICLVVAFAGIGLFTANVWAITQTLAGPARAGAWTGLQNAFGNMGGVVAPILTGWFVGRGLGYWPAFTTASLMLGLGALFYGILLPRYAPASLPHGRVSWPT